MSDLSRFGERLTVEELAAVLKLSPGTIRNRAITRLSKKLDVLALARMVGHKDLGMLQRYYRESAEEIAKRL